MLTKIILLDSGLFWERICEDDPYDQQPEFKLYDVIAGHNAKWELSIQPHDKAKYNKKNVTTKSILAMLDHVKHELQQNANAAVLCESNNIRVIFGNA